MRGLVEEDDAHWGMQKYLEPLKLRSKSGVVCNPENHSAQYHQDCVIPHETCFQLWSYRHQILLVFILDFLIRLDIHLRDGTFILMRQMYLCAQKCFDHS